MDLFSDYDSLSESSSSSDDQQDDIELLYCGEASNILSCLEESIGKIDDLLSVEMGFMYGDIVSSNSDPTGQTGKVISINMHVDLENLHGKTMKDVDSNHIAKIRSLSVGDFVLLGSWVGKVDKIEDRVAVLFDDGSKSSFTATEKLIIPISTNLLEDCDQFPYYPGQRVQVELSSTTNSRSDRWLCCAWKGRRNEGTVFAVEAGLVYVEWLSCALVDSSDKIPLAPPSCLQDADNLSLLSCFSHANWQLGDWCVLPGLESEIYVIVKTKTKVDVMWQDGSHSFAVDANSLFQVNIVDAHDFWPGQFVLEKGSCDDLVHVSSGRRWGFVRTYDSKERMVKVEWSVPDSNPNQEEMDVSAYELVEHPDYSFCYGDVVFQIKKVEVIGEEKKEQNQLSCVGTVFGFKDGKVLVEWANGCATKVAPYEIFRMDKSEQVSSSSMHLSSQRETIEQAMIQEISDSRNPPFQPKEKSLLVCLLPQAAVGIFSSIIGSLFGSQSTSHESGGIIDHTFSEEHGYELVESEPIADNFQIFGERNSQQPLFSTDSKMTKSFKRFDMAGDCSDHHFFDVAAKKGLTSSVQMKRGWLKRVQTEWSMMEKDLPETIFVRVYEERMDLLRVAIIGTPGTPYHDSLFFFDIFLPPEYPHEPPLVHYISSGLRLNPNLYETGKVCLSLLNTWMGSGNEVWNPERSSLLQILISLQALVLNRKPYFNEAGYDKQMGTPEGEKNSASYNENAFLVSCKSMFYLLRKPPKNFEALVDEHFIKCSHNILLACKAYMNGTRVGCAFGDENREEEKRGSSTGFKIMLSKMFPKLLEAFSAKGVDCSQFVNM
ncbi:probable ubiquitin-conjugating enzyme E2 24 [Impatiens glandulifera]|uniref:probable ubiquitin-conjugating enzyme E2 24 n=1 Tax=Impatiens glandulifera TaxID=253017 RepID=UPI001FB0E74A|nr:probable ubiquitin-conjugating enzyme E2 24 [Impatiens glandulifera]